MRRWSGMPPSGWARRLAIFAGQGRRIAPAWMLARPQPPGTGHDRATWTGRADGSATGAARPLLLKPFGAMSIQDPVASEASGLARGEASGETDGGGRAGAASAGAAAAGEGAGADAASAGTAAAASVVGADQAAAAKKAARKAEKREKAAAKKKAATTAEAAASAPSGNAPVPGSRRQSKQAAPPARRAREAAIAAAAEAARAAGPPDPAVLYAEFLRLATSDGKYPPSYTQEEHFFREREANGGGWKLKNLYTDLDSARQGRVTLPLTDAGLFGREYDAAVDALRPTLVETFYPSTTPSGGRRRATRRRRRRRRAIASPRA